MGSLRNAGFTLAVFALAACGERQETPPPASAPANAAARPVIRFVCDSINEPIILVATEPAADGTFVLREYARAGGAALARERLVKFGQEESGAGSIFRTILLASDGAEIGGARWINPGMIAEPSAAYTAPLTSIRLDDKQIECRWLERTRVIGFTARRSFVISEDADGDLIYRSYDFADPAARQRIDLDGAQRTTPFNIEIRGGAELQEADALTFDFRKDGFVYEMRARDGELPILTLKRGNRVVQSDEILSYQSPKGTDEPAPAAL